MMSLGMGPAPISYTDIHHWVAITQTEITPWDAHVLRELSKAYVVQLNSSKDPNTPPPYCATPTQEQREDVTNKFKAFVKQRNSKKRGLGRG